MRAFYSVGSGIFQSTAQSKKRFPIRKRFRSSAQSCGESKLAGFSHYLERGVVVVAARMEIPRLAVRRGVVVLSRAVPKKSSTFRTLEKPSRRPDTTFGDRAPGPCG